jgi:hypothetical protein
MPRWQDAATAGARSFTADCTVGSTFVLRRPGWVNMQHRRAAPLAPPVHSGSTFRRLAGADFTDI